jgi:hypothetical protein
MLSFHVPAWLALAGDLPVLAAGLWAGYKWGARAVAVASAVKADVAPAASAAKNAVQDVKKA